METTVETATSGLLGCSHRSEWLKIPGRPCSARETEVTCTLTTPAKVVMEKPEPSPEPLNLGGEPSPDLVQVGY